MRTERTLNRRRKKGFTLVEIMIVVVLIGILSTMAIPAFRKVRENTNVRTVVNDFQKYADAFSLYNLETGAWPASAAQSVVPVGMDGYLPKSYTSDSSIGGGFTWTEASRQLQLQNSSTTEDIMARVDQVLDDGDTTEGRFQIQGANYFFILEQ